MMVVISAEDLVALAKDMDVTPQAITNYLGREKLPYEKIIEFGKRYKKSLDWLFGIKSLGKYEKGGIKLAASTVLEAETQNEYLTGGELDLLKEYRTLSDIQKAYIAETIKMIKGDKGGASLNESFGQVVKLKKNHKKE